MYSKGYDTFWWVFFCSTRSLSGLYRIYAIFVLTFMLPSFSQLYFTSVAQWVSVIDHLHGNSPPTGSNILISHHDVTWPRSRRQQTGGTNPWQSGVIGPATTQQHPPSVRHYRSPAPCNLLSHLGWQTWHPNWIRLALNGTNLGLFKISFSTINWP